MAAPLGRLFYGYRLTCPYASRTAEFDVAHQPFKADGKRLIDTYFMGTTVCNDLSMHEALNSLWRFQAKLSPLGHYHTQTSRC